MGSPVAAPLDREASATTVILASSAAVALALGTVIYLLDRDWSTILFLAPLAPWQWPRAGLFGAAGQALPSFLHAYALATLLVLILAPARSSARAGLCVGWFVIAAALECLQADAVATTLFRDGILSSHHTLLAPVARYALQGSFDTADLWATAIGCGLAFLVTLHPERPS